MATQQDLKARLIVEAATEGDGEIEALASELESLAREGGGAAPKLQALAASLREMGQQDQAVSHFAALRRQTADTATAMDAASATVDRLAQELEQASGAARQAASAQADAARSVQQARERQAQLKDAIAQTNAELKAARAAYREGGGDSEQYARQIGEGAAQLKVLKAEQKQAAAEVRALANAQRDAAAQSRAAAQTQQAVASEYERAVKSASQLSGTLREQNQALAQARQALDSAGLSTQGLSDQQAELRASLVQAERQAADYVEVVRQMRAESGALGPALQATFKQLGMRGVAQITAEIEQLQAAMRGLKGQKLLPEDASRLTTELQRRIESLRGEMKGAQGEARGAADAVGQLGDRSRTAGSQIGAAAHKALAWTTALVGLNELRQVASNVLETGSAFEQLDRRLTGILGSAEKAGHAMAMIKGGGGALTREKIVAAVATKFVCIADGSKLVRTLGTFPLPVEVIPMARAHVARELAALGGTPRLREGFVTDNGNLILDVHGLSITDPKGLETEIDHITGVVTSGLFARRGADVLLLGTDDGVKTLIA